MLVLLDDGGLDLFELGEEPPEAGIIGASGEVSDEEVALFLLDELALGLHGFLLLLLGACTHG